MAELVPVPLASPAAACAPRVPAPARHLRPAGAQVQAPARPAQARRSICRCRTRAARAANPIGPAAGPHTQLAQNIALGWLAGARIFELKTVQINDRLTLSRPCIDMATVGYNTEWSQELRLEESLREYVKASMLIEILGAWGLVGMKAERPQARGERGLGSPDAFVFDISVGYDLEGHPQPALWCGGSSRCGMRARSSTICAVRSRMSSRRSGLSLPDMPGDGNHPVDVPWHAGRGD